ncbi:uncharacterized protein LOC119105764 [Pollicipes pollicipes]|uniref:uncharacterized protein LOC119105764 n=1 Tax=Pollicipes pollicipes TaxID=41117 RepID=UPI0018854C2F|nr:uncharacterized protein LOC119105764 [Pollicipes pollicipes]
MIMIMHVVDNASAQPAAKTRYGGVGSDPISRIAFPKRTVGIFSVSGSRIKVTGLSTLRVTHVKLFGDSVLTILQVKKLVIKGQFLLQYGRFKQRFTLTLTMGGVIVSGKTTFSGASGRPVVKDIKVDIQVNSMKADVGKNLLLGSLVETWINNNEKLNKETLPWLARLMRFWLKSILTKYLNG